MERAGRRWNGREKKRVGKRWNRRGDEGDWMERKRETGARRRIKK